MRTKRYLLIAALLMLIAESGKTQGADNGLDVRAVQGVVPGFRLWFANNVTDVQDFDKIASAESGLEWREVHDKDIDGNSAEVDRVRQMLASTGM